MIAQKTVFHGEQRYSYSFFKKKVRMLPLFIDDDNVRHKPVEELTDLYLSKQMVRIVTEVE